MRLDKFLVDCGVGSRSQVKTFLKKKQVTVKKYLKLFIKHMMIIKIHMLLSITMCYKIIKQMPKLAIMNLY